MKTFTRFVHNFQYWRAGIHVKLFNNWPDIDWFFLKNKLNHHHIRNFTEKSKSSVRTQFLANRWFEFPRFKKTSIFNRMPSSMISYHIDKKFSTIRLQINLLKNSISSYCRTYFIIKTSLQFDSFFPLELFNWICS